MNVHKTWILLLFLLIPTFYSLKKQEQSGKSVHGVRYPKRGRTLTYASIVILSGKDSTFIKGAASDTDGHFNLQLTTQKGTQYLLKAS